MPELVELPYYKRPDLTPYLIHLTKRGSGGSAMDNLRSIVREGAIRPSSSQRGFIKGNEPATCFMDVPIAALKHVLTEDNVDGTAPRYEPFGIMVGKKYAYEHGARPVLHLSDDELNAMRVPQDQLWRVVKFQLEGEDWKSWHHEREWRAPGPFPLPSRPGVLAALVRTTGDVQKLRGEMEASAAFYATRPLSIIPLQVACEGLPYLSDSVVD